VFCLEGAEREFSAAAAVAPGVRGVGLTRSGLPFFVGHNPTHPRQSFFSPIWSDQAEDQTPITSTREARYSERGLSAYVGSTVKVRPSSFSVAAPSFRAAM